MEEFVSEALQAADHDVLFDKIMTEYGQNILNLVYSYVKNKVATEDLTQEIFVKCYRSLHTFEHQSKIKTWLCKIAINHCKDYLKSWHFQRVQSFDPNDMPVTASKNDTENEVVRKDEQQEVVAALLQLPLKYREVIYLYYFEDLSLKEMEQLTKIKLNTIKTRMRKAKELLKNVLED